MTLNIPSEYAHVLDEAVASGAFASTDEAIRHALSLLAAEHHIVDGEPPTEDDEQWAARFEAWAESHTPSKHFVDCSRDSIYDGRDK
ncbi:hypothetical protein CA51_37770 [Rosistilla oblonga]|uniref:ribbon-helix-helix domain-containing protein n=1 Tax=Rosistilla oblonga TaxID=2527990 RepID=UPI00118ACEC2|nr:hypothetical protein [Rosistilla oblonga]QDV13886.1 hypothetical protein CA51_37770 [Rosistilla oblonga]